MIALSRWPAWIWAKIWTCWLFVRGTNLILQLRFSNSLIMYILCQNAHSTYHQGRPDKGGWSPERCWSRLSGKGNKPIRRESLKKGEKVQVAFYIYWACFAQMPRWGARVSTLVATGVASHSVQMHLMLLAVLGTARWARLSFNSWNAFYHFVSGSYLVGPHRGFRDYFEGTY